MKYRKLFNWKYEIAEDISRQTEIRGYAYQHKYFELKPDGTLCLKAGYKWDGATVCPDVDSIMEGSAFHDALYQLGRLKVIPETCKIKADELLYEICIEKHMPEFLANWVYSGVNIGGDSCWNDHEWDADKDEIFEA